MGLAARAGLQVPAYDVLEVVAEEEVVLLEHGDDEAPALAVAAGAARVPADHLHDREILREVRAVPLLARAPEERQRLEAGARHEVLLRGMIARDREVQVALRIEPCRTGGVGVGTRDVPEQPVHVGTETPPDLDDVAHVTVADRRSRRDGEHAERVDPVAEVPASRVRPERMRIGEAHPRAQSPAPATARRGRVVDLEVAPRPEDERRTAARPRRRAEPDARGQRRPAVVAERRVLLLAPPQPVLARGPDQAEGSAGAAVGAAEPGRLELLPEERDGHRPHAVELPPEALLPEAVERLARHRLDRRVVVPIVAHDVIAPRKRGGPAASGMSVSGTSSTSIWTSTVAFTRSATARRSASGSRGVATVPAGMGARSWSWLGGWPWA